MLYIYYMKISRNYWMLFLSLFLFTAANAQVTVVKVTDDKVYLDTSSFGKTVQKGDTFKVILSAEKLNNPQTGKDLGFIYTYSPEGKITEVQPLYAVGARPDKTKITVGQEAVIEAASFQTTITPATQAAVQAAPVSNRAFKRYHIADQTIIGLTEGTVSAPNARDIITLADDGKITLWQRGEKELTPLLSYQLPSGKKGISVSAAPVKEGGLDEIFVSVFDEDRQTLTTFVLENQDGKLAQTDSMNYLVKELGCGKDKKLFAQRPFIMQDRPGNAREVEYKKGHFTAGKNGFSTQYNWLTGLTYYPVQAADYNNLIYTAYNGQLRMILSNGKRAESKNDFGSSPKRISYKQQIVRFYPAIQVFGANDKAIIAAVENTTKLGLLSDTFAQYQDGKIHFLTYEQGRLVDQEVLELDGVLYDTACADDFMLTAEALSDGSSNVVLISKN